METPELNLQKALILSSKFPYLTERETVSNSGGVQSMTGFEIDLPPEWTKRTGETDRDSAVAEYQYATADDVPLIVSIVPRADGKAYNLHLLTSNSTRTPCRQAFPVKEYGSRPAAVAGAESFIDHLSLHLQNGSMSSANPGTGEIRAVLREFSDEPRFSSIRHLISVFQ